MKTLTALTVLTILVILCAGLVNAQAPGDCPGCAHFIPTRTPFVSPLHAPVLQEWRVFIPIIERKR